MIDMKTAENEYREMAVKGMDSLFAMQKQVMDSTFAFYEKGIAFQEESYGKASKQVDEWTKTFSDQLDVQQAKAKAITSKVTESLAPGAKEQFEMMEKMVEENVGKARASVKEMLVEKSDLNAKNIVSFKKDWLNEFRDGYEKNMVAYQDQVSELINPQDDKKVAVAKKVAK